MQIKNISAITLLLLMGVLVQVKGQRVDKTHDGLKGAVKTVSLEIVRFDLIDGKKYVEKPRVPAEIRTYDEAGNQTRFEYYDDDGILQNTLVYDFIGKQRVAKSIDAPTRNALVTVIPLPKGTRIDPRYTYKYVHQYDAQDRRIQTLVYLSSGELWQRHTFKFSKNRMTHMLYSRGRLNSKTEHNLDERETRPASSSTPNTSSLTRRSISTTSLMPRETGPREGCTEASKKSKTVSSLALIPGAWNIE